MQTQLNESRKTLLQRLLQGDRSGHSGKIAQRTGNRACALLSYSQQRLWFLEQLNPGTSFYNIATELVLGGELDVPALERSLNELVVRHESLRTRFVVEKEEPRQVIDGAQPKRLEVEEVPHWEDVERHAEEEAGRAFDLARGPLFRVRLLRVGEDRHVMLFTTHHIITDQWSLGILVKELKQLYGAFTAGRPSPLGELTLQYADYAEWQREWLKGNVLEEQLEYWRKQLRDVATLSLPLDRARGLVPSYRGGRRGFALGKEVTEKIKELSRQEKVTVFMTLLASFQAMLARYSGQREVVVGAPIAGRTRVELEGIVGFFVNTLVLRTDVEGNPSFRELLQRVQEVTLGAYAHQDVPFEKLVEELQPERDLGRNPLFQVAFNLESAPIPEISLGNARLVSTTSTEVSAKFDLELSASLDDGDVHGWLEYSMDLWDEETVEGMLRHWERLLEAGVREPERRLSELGMLSGEERQWLVEEWNRTEREYGREETVAELIEAQVERDGEAIAVVAGEEQITYGELNRRANCVAHYLQRLGVGPEVRVGICVERSAEMIVGLLGVLKAGGAYVPLDPEFPSLRKRQMIRQSNVAIILTGGTVTKLVDDELMGMEVVVWPISVLQMEGSPEQFRRICTACPDALLYIIYTSGSSGEPKGVMVPTRGVLNQLHAKIHELKLGPEDIVAHTAPLCFDISVWQMWAALAVGGRIVIFSENEIRRPELLVRRAMDTQVSVMELVPTVICAILDIAAAPKSAELKRLRCLLTTGEPTSREMCSAWQRRYGRMRIINAYGPTECSDDVTHAELRDCQSDPVPIGRPIGNMQLYVLDEEMELVVPGVVGELYVGGVGVGRGYVGKAELTGERFVPDPYGKKRGGRLYRTGDLVRHGKTGELEFLGRKDQQVKIRGYRIELGEIEAVLREHAGVGEVVVEARSWGGVEDKRLVAYVVGKAGVEAEGRELRRHVKERLPEYMVPAAYVRLEAMPVTANGKLDRRKLPEPEAEGREEGEGYVEPRTATEKKLVEIWSAVLGRQQVGIHDNFFELGGHSLMAAQVMSRIRKLFHIEVPVRQMFTTPSISELSDAIVQMQIGCIPDDQFAEMLSDIEALSEDKARHLLSLDIGNLESSCSN